MLHLRINALCVSDFGLCMPPAIHVITLEEAEHVTMRGGSSVAARAPVRACARALARARAFAVVPLSNMARALPYDIFV